MREYDKRDENGARYSYEARTAGLPPEYEEKFRAATEAWEFFEKQAPWYRRAASFWVMDAKREETRERRLKTLIADSAAGRRIGPLTRPVRRNAGLAPAGTKHVRLSSCASWMVRWAVRKRRQTRR